MQSVLNLIALSTCFFAAVVDIRSGRIPNWLTLPALGLAIGLQILFGQHWDYLNWQEYLWNAMFLALCLPILLAPRCFGGGDLKLVLVLMVTLGMQRTIIIVILAAFTAAIAIGLRGRYNRLSGSDQGHIGNSVSGSSDLSRGSSIELAPFFAGYCILVLLTDYCGSLGYE